MKKTTFFLFLIFLTHFSFGQIIDIPDANFKNALVNTNCVYIPGEGYTADVDTNDDGEIEVSEALAVNTRLSIGGQSISSLDGIENFSNLTNLNISFNQISSFDFTWLPNLTRLTCTDNLFTTLDLSNALNLFSLECSNNQLMSIDNIGATLFSLVCNMNQLTTLNLENATSLDVLECSDNQLISLDLSNSNMYEFYCANNPSLTSLELTSTLDYLTLNNVGVSEIDVSEMMYMTQFSCINNPNLTFIQLGGDNSDDSNFYIENNPVLELISLKNGLSNYNGFEYGNYSICNNPSLSFVCADEAEIDGFSYTIDEGGNIITIGVDGAQQMVNNCGYTNVVVSSYCSFVPGGDYYFIEGNTKLDLDANGCDSNDDALFNLQFLITSGSQTGSFITNTAESYSIPVGNGMHTLTPVLENPDYFTVSPSSVTVNFPADDSPFMQDFCITPDGTFNDLEITMFPLDGARPGFDANYKLIYKNKGNTSLSGSVDLTFQDDLMDLVSASPTEDSQSANMLSWNFTDLTPFESREIYLTMNINSPMETPPVNGDDVLVFDASVNSSETDETPDDNSFTLNQTVVNSFDPNDKTCLEGDVISPEQVGDFVHYRIRFENTGTANAINIVVKDHIDRNKYDLSSLVALDASHDYVARIKDDADDYYVEFIFENINLPFDDANNDGYVVFKIRTLDTLVLNDTFENEAEIYFDFNFPIITNVAQTTVATLSTEDYELANISVLLYPNPNNGILHLETKEAIKQINVYDISGRQIKEIAAIGSKLNIEISTEALYTGTYFVKIKTETNEFVKKFVKD